MTAFHAPVDASGIQLIDHSAFVSTFGRNAESFFKDFNIHGSQSVAALAKWRDKIALTDETMQEYLTDCMQKKVPASFDGYNKYVQSAIASTKQFTLSAMAGKAALQALAMVGNMIVFALIIKGIEFLISTINNWIHSLDTARNELEDVNSSIKGINSELATTTSRIDELNAKENLSLVEAEELEKLKTVNAELERELHLKEGIAKIKGEKANKEALLYFDKASGSLADQFMAQLKEDILNFDFFRKDSIHSAASPVFTDKINEADYYIEQAEKLKQQLAGITDTESREYKSISTSIKDFEVNLADMITDFMEKDDLLIEGNDNGFLDRLNALYEKYDIYTNGRGYVVENKLSSILAKVNFKEYAKELEELGKSGELSLDTLSSRFPDLIAYTNKAGISAQELYEYIMALSNPDAINYSEVRKQLLAASGINDGETGSTSDEKILNKLESAGALSNEGLEAYIAVRAKYDTSEFDVNDLIYYIRNELENGLAENEATLSISQTIDQLNTRLRPAFESLGSAYRDIFADDGFNPGAVDLPMLDSTRSSIEELNSLQDVDINIDMGAFDALASTLTAAGVTQGQAEQAFNDFATSVFYASDATAGMTEETRGLVEQLLESLGVANAAEAAGYALLEAKAQSVLAAHDLADASREECASLLAEGQAAGLTRQQIYGLTAAEIAYGQSGLSTEQKIQRLKDLAAAYGDTASAALATAIANDLASGHTDVDSAMDDLVSRMNAGIRKARLDFSGLDRAAAKAGSSAGRSYADALKEELSGLNSVISYIGSVIGDQIDLFNDQKDAAVEALEAEKQAAQEALEAEKALVQEKIDARQEEVDRIREAASARKEEISLQKAQYDLARMQGQQAVLQYSHGRGMHYVTDTEGLREAREAYTEAKENIRVSGIQKEISGLQDTVDGLDRKLEESARHYDSLIEQTEKYWDGLIQGLENYKSRWQELAGIEEQAKMEAALRNLGITPEDVMNLSESAFEAFKGHYLGVLQEIHANNEDVLQMLQRFGGVSADALRPLAGSLATVTENIRDASTAIGGRAGNPAKDPSLTDSIVLLGETTEETLGEPDGDGTTGRFTELGRTIAAAGTHVAEVANGMESLDGMTAECTITVNIETTGSLPEVAVGTGIADAVTGIPGSKSHATAPGNNTPSKNNAPAKGNSPSKGSTGQGTATKVRGHASVAGDWNVREAGRTLVGELGRELWVHAKDGTFETVGDSGAEFIRTEKGDLILSHQQTEALLAVGHITVPSNTPTVPKSTPSVPGNTTTIPEPAPAILPYDPANDPTPFGDAVRKWDAAMAKLDAQARADLLNTSVVSYDRDRQIQETINRINNTSISTQNVRPNINVGGISITCPGVTSQAVMREVKTALNREFNGLHNFADQWIRQ